MEPPRRRRHWTTIVISAVGVVTLVGLVAPCCFWGTSMWWMVRKAEAEVTRRQQQILYHTNAADLYAACLDVYARRDTFRRDMKWSDPKDFIDPADPALPPIILGLRATTITTLPNGLRVEMGGGFHHYGVDAFVPGHPGSGTKLLTPGLWYYDEAGKVPPP